MPCAIETCERPLYCRGWCNPHWHKWLRYGDPLGGMPWYKTTSDRFWAKVNKDGPIGYNPDLGQCWVWTGAVNPAGYGCCAIGTYGESLAHRYSYIETMGKIRRGLVLDHLCRNPPCVRPDHLEAVTHEINMKRGIWPTPKTHCPQGHPLSGDNLYINPTSRGTGKVCRECTRISGRAYKQRKREERAAAKR